MNRTTMTGPTFDRSGAARVLSRVPEITIFFWIIKVLATTVGETAADYLNVNLNLGLSGTTVVMTIVLIAALAAQFAMRRYVPPVYWLAVVLISIVGTLITDNLVDNLGVSLWTTTIVFAIALAVTFALWFRSERSLSIHTILTAKREAYYWLAVLFTFALGTAAGDLAAEGLGLGYLVAAAIFGALIAATYLAHRYAGLNAILAFWIAYVLTRPLGASIGDLLAQQPEDGGLGFGTVITSALFLVAIALVVIFLTVSKKDQIVIAKDGRARDQ
ncbi:MAG: hypothetical protein ABI780_12435 [Ardenticatenales bacterium]